MSFALVDLLQEPTFSHLVSASLHLVLLLAISVSWVWRKIALDAENVYNEKFKSTQYKKTLLCTFGAFAFNLVLGLLYCFYWYGHDRSDENLVALLDLAFKTVAWGIVCASLRAGIFSSGERRFPLFFRAWCAFYILISCYCFVLDIVLHLRHVSLPIQHLVSDGISFFLSLCLCYVGFFVKHEGEDSILQEPLLDDDNNTDFSNALESNKTKEEEHVTPYSNAEIFSILTFSWVGPLIDAGKRKTLNFEDVPQLAICDRVAGAFPAFRNKLEEECGTLKRVTTLKLVKSLILSSWEGILATAIAALLNTLTSYVGPYLIDTFVQYLNGKQTFKNEGYVLVAAFLVAKLIECMSHRQWFFRLKRVGIKTRALLVTIVYSKGLTLSCQSKQGHTTGEIINFMTVDAERVGDFAWKMHDLWIVVLQVALAMVILYRNLGMASIAAFIATVAVMFINVPFASLQKTYQNKLMESKDRRLKATSEILRNMRILKLQGWEMKFLSKVIELRNTEETG